MSFVGGPLEYKTRVGSAKSDESRQPTFRAIKKYGGNHFRTQILILVFKISQE